MCDKGPLVSSRPRAPNFCGPALSSGGDGDGTVRQRRRRCRAATMAEDELVGKTCVLEEEIRRSAAVQDATAQNTLEREVGTRIVRQFPKFD